MRLFNKYLFRQCLLSIGVILDFFLGGAALSFSATLLPQLQANGSTIVITEEEGTWIASIELLSGLIGAILSVILIELSGQKWTYTFVAFANATSWIIIACSTKLWHILLGRTIQGIAYGISNTVCYCLIGEVALMKYRNLMTNLVYIGVSVGMLLADLMGTFCTWNFSACIFAVMSLSCFVTFLNMKNTYVWYLTRDRLMEAEQSFIWYHGRDNGKMIEFCIEVAEQQKTPRTIKHVASELVHREFILPLLIVTWFHTSILFTGSYGILLYSISVMSSTVVSIDAFLTTIILDVIRIFSCIITSILITFMPIRAITNVGSLLTILSIAVLCMAKYWEDTVIELKWVTFVSVLLFYFVDTTGHTNVCTIIVCELFTGCTKTIGIAITSMHFLSFYFLTAQYIPTMFLQLGAIWSFAIFGICNIIGSIGLYFVLPETFHRNRDDIRAYFKDRNMATNILNRLCLR